MVFLLEAIFITALDRVYVMKCLLMSVKHHISLLVQHVLLQLCSQGVYEVDSLLYIFVRPRHLMPQHLPNVHTNLYRKIINEKYSLLYYIGLMSY